SPSSATPTCRPCSESGVLSTLDGVKLDLNEGWVHLRPSNTEPIVRVYAEAGSQAAADALAIRFKQELMGSVATAG
ncbi:MAG: hypothetical protein AAFR95_16260, partial [Bacteroidota bacterium]